MVSPPSGRLRETALVAAGSACKTTRLFRDGQNIKIISERLGQSSVGATLEVYAYLTEDAQDAAVAAMDRLLGSAEEATQAAIS
jgi:integrase